MERRIEQYDCAESALLLKTFAGIRQTIMQRELAMDKEQHKMMQNKKKAIKTVGMPPSGLFWLSNLGSNKGSRRGALKVWAVPNHSNN